MNEYACVKLIPCLFCENIKFLETVVFITWSGHACSMLFLLMYSLFVFSFFFFNKLSNPKVKAHFKIWQCTNLYTNTSISEDFVVKQLHYFLHLYMNNQLASDWIFKSQYTQTVAKCQDGSMNYAWVQLLWDWSRYQVHQYRGFRNLHQIMKT